MVSDFDEKLLHILSQDGRKRLKYIAKELNVSITTVKNHMDALEEDGVIERFTIKADAESLGYTDKALIAARFERGTLVDMQEKIARHPDVLAVYDITGRYDAMIVCRLKEVHELDNFIKNVLPTEHVTETETFVVLNTVKEDFTSL